MGRGRAKAKQTKVARRLKYSSGPSTDLQALEAELKGDEAADEESADDDPYADDAYGADIDDEDHR